MKPFLFLLPLVGSVLAMPTHEAEAETASCTCETVFCTQAWPDSCYCANNAKKACYEKCGGSVPIYNVCPPKARAPEPEPEPEPESELTIPTSIPCECEIAFCLQSWPESCHCANDAKKACYDRCGGPKPVYQACPALTPAAPVPRSEEATPECKCTEVNCLQIWPAGCHCANYAKQLCYQECGGEKPVLNVCPPLPTPPSTTAPTPPAARNAQPTNKVCGRGHGTSFPACSYGQVCVRDPFSSTSCGPACGEPGICIENKMCGGLAGLACEQPGQVCVDDPRDNCDSKHGGADCAGVCVWPQ